MGDDEWHFGQTTLIDARLNRLVFQLTGDAVRAAVDDIRVVDGECPLDRSQSIVTVTVSHCSNLVHISSCRLAFKIYYSRSYV